MSPLDADALECVAAILEEGSFHGAARVLSITQSAVSQRLRALEDRIGTPLIVRTRPLKATAAGAVVLKHASQARLLRADVERDLRELAPGSAKPGRKTERVSIAIGADSIATWALPALDALVSRGLLLEIISDDRHFTHESLREGHVVGCVSPMKQAIRGCHVVPLGTLRYAAVAASAYASQHCPAGLTPHNFAALDFVAVNRKDDIQAEFVGRAFGLREVGLRQLLLPGPEAQMRAVMAGWGAGVVPELLATPGLEQETLVDLLPGFRLSVPLYWHCWQLESEVLEQLTSALRQARPGQDYSLEALRIGKPANGFSVRSANAERVSRTPGNEAATLVMKSA
ncbi:ArgP/LysG family DNA-binding transcriptional regulator [Ramlibacter sp. WS9]|uniref:ArgP/LysG family DNA-binding transcriptional regulator n=1 Tax=Ramlibacter sp. WS9 TaxID=1882741 RepID=UPI001142E452|nr:ArgP/LysG family DNA-binding transcriptional regulator [Ramlibacter sp. WS9]ROZ79195.1 ArgP/LysG family DNA-binding transcriptional regulator [Ramlibacter sp. WS9]